EGGVATVRVVPALDEFEDGQARLNLGVEALAIEELALERREEALTERVVVRVADGSHRRPDAHLAAALAEGERRVLAALIRVMNDVDRAALREGHVEGLEHEFGPEVCGHCPANDAAAPGVEDDGEVQKAGPGRDVGDVGDPELIWDSRCEVAVHEIRYGPGVAITDGRLGVLAPAHPGQAQHPHESRDPLAADVNAEGRQLRMDPALPVRA